MAGLKRGRSKRLVVDIGSSSIRVTELSQTKAGYQLTKYMQRDLPVDPSMDEEERQKIQAETLKALLKDSKIRHKKVIFGVPGQSVFTRTRALPPVQEHKVTQIVRYEIQQQIPFSLDQIALDYQVLKRTDAGGYEVLMTAIKVDVVEKHLEVIKSAKRSIDVVDVCPLAAYNWLKHTGEFGEEGECVALIDLGASTTEIVIERENQFRFTRSLNVAGNDVTEAISESFNMPYADAERLKRERGFAPTGDPRRDGKGGEVIGKVLQRLVNEINRSFAFFRTQPGGGTVSRVIVTGGGACLRNMIPYLQRQLGVEVRIAQPLAGLAIAPGAQQVNEHPEQAATVLGLALRTQETAPIEINLIPPRVLELARAKEQTFYWALSIATLALIMASIIPVNANNNNAVLDQIKTVEKQLEQYDPELLATGPNGNVTKPSRFETELQEETAKVNTYKGQLENLDEVMSNRTYWLNYLVDIADARPQGKGVWFSSIETTNIGKKELAGSVKKDKAAGGLAAGMANLQGLGGGLLTGSGVGSATPKLNTTGFSGIQPRMSGGGGGMGIRGGGNRAPAKVLPPVAPNGLTVFGYAHDPETIMQFVGNLRQNDHFVKVFFFSNSSNPVPLSDLAKAQTGGRPAAAAAAGSSQKKKSGMASSMSALAGGAVVGGGGQYNAPQAPAQQVWSFRVDIQFSGKPVDLDNQKPNAGAQPAAAGGANANNVFGNLGNGGGGLFSKHSKPPSADKAEE